MFFLKSWGYLTALEGELFMRKKRSSEVRERGWRRTQSIGTWVGHEILPLCANAWKGQRSNLGFSVPCPLCL